jgi:hypothetical protein
VAASALLTLELMNTHCIHLQHGIESWQPSNNNDINELDTPIQAEELSQHNNQKDNIYEFDLRVRKFFIFSNKEELVNSHTSICDVVEKVNDSINESILVQNRDYNRGSDDNRVYEYSDNQSEGEITAMNNPCNANESQSMDDTNNSIDMYNQILHTSNNVDSGDISHNNYNNNDDDSDDDRYFTMLFNDFVSNIDDELAIDNIVNETMLSSGSDIDKWQLQLDSPYNYSNSNSVSDNDETHRNEFIDIESGNLSSSVIANRLVIVSTNEEKDSEICSESSTDDDDW